MAEIFNVVTGNANEVCFSMAVVISVLFYRQYRKYEEEEKTEELLNQFLDNTSNANNRQASVL